MTLHRFGLLIYLPFLMWFGNHMGLDSQELLFVAFVWAGVAFIGWTPEKDKK